MCRWSQVEVGDDTNFCFHFDWLSNNSRAKTTDGHCYVRESGAIIKKDRMVLIGDRHFYHFTVPNKHWCKQKHLDVKFLMADLSGPLIWFLSPSLLSWVAVMPEFSLYQSSILTLHVTDDDCSNINKIKATIDKQCPNLVHQGDQFFKQFFLEAYLGEGTFQSDTIDHIYTAVIFSYVMLRLGG